MRYVMALVAMCAMCAVVQAGVISVTLSTPQDTDAYVIELVENPDVQDPISHVQALSFTLTPTPTAEYFPSFPADFPNNGTDIFSSAALLPNQYGNDHKVIVYFDTMLNAGDFFRVDVTYEGGSQPAWDAYPLPEPATLGLLAAGAVALLRRRRHN